MLQTHNNTWAHKRGHTLTGAQQISTAILETPDDDHIPVETCSAAAM
jgi:hypothetical protein